jgi:hypothetical protein
MSLARHMRAATATSLGVAFLVTVASLTGLVLGANGLYGDVRLSVEVPVVLLGGLLLWQRKPLGYACAAGLMLQYGLTPVALAIGLLLQATVTGSAVAWGTVMGVLVFAMVCFAPLTFFVRAAGTRSTASERAPARVAAPGLRI